MFARCITGLALTIGALATLGLFLPDALAAPRYERTVRHDSSAPRTVCIPMGDPGLATSPSDGPGETCIELSQEFLDALDREEVNRVDRHIGRLGVVTSVIALIIGWQLWRPPWKQPHPTINRVRTTMAAACGSPLAAIAILATTRLLYWYDTTLR